MTGRIVQIYTGYLRRESASVGAARKRVQQWQEQQELNRLYSANGPGQVDSDQDFIKL